MSSGRRRKSEDSQPQFEKKRERGETEEREKQEQDERDGERLERERIEETKHMEENGESTEMRPQTDIDTDVEQTQSRREKGQMKSIFLSDSEEEAIVEFVKQHKELLRQDT